MLGAGSAVAQKVAVKTNIPYWATTTPNLGFEFGLGARTTLDISGGYNFWTLNREANRKIKHFVVMPEVRWWLCERFNGHFFGLHAGYTEYNISNVRIPFRPASSKDHRYQGWGGRRGYLLRIFMDYRPPVEPGGDGGCGICLYRLRQIRLRDLRNLSRYQYQTLLRPDEDRHFVRLHN